MADQGFRIVCPYCTKEISPGSNHCTECGTTYGSDTLKILRNLTDKPDSADVKEQRNEDRVPKKFKISFANPEVLQDHYLTNISTGGIFIETPKPFMRGARFDLRVFLPDGEQAVDVYCEVVWAQNQERVIDKRLYPPGMGIKFLNLTPEGRNRIDSLLRRR